VTSESKAALKQSKAAAKRRPVFILLFLWM